MRRIIISNSLISLMSIGCLIYRVSFTYLSRLAIRLKPVAPIYKISNNNLRNYFSITSSDFKNVTGLFTVGFTFFTVPYGGKNKES